VGVILLLLKPVDQRDPFFKSSDLLGKCGIFPSRRRFSQDCLQRARSTDGDICSSKPQHNKHVEKKVRLENASVSRQLVDYTCSALSLSLSLSEESKAKQSPELRIARKEGITQSKIIVKTATNHLRTVKISV